jgi:hypothetical protein
MANPAAQFLFSKENSFFKSADFASGIPQLAKLTNAAGILLETEKENKIGNQLYPSSGFGLYDKTNFYFWDNPE